MSLSLVSNNDGSGAININGSPALNISSNGVLTTQTPATSDNSTKIATTAFAMGAGLGVNQTWQDVTASRSIGQPYTNSTGKPIQVAILVQQVAGGGAVFKINDVAIMQLAGSVAGAFNHVQLIISNGSTYGVFTTGATMSLTSWFELR